MELCTAATNADLKDVFAHVPELGDFSVVYRVAGLLEDVQSLISARSNLRACVLDALHAAGVEIVSPSFMNTRALPQDARVIPPHSETVLAPEADVAEAVAFDKADAAASVEEIRRELETVDRELESMKDAEPAAAGETLNRRREALQRRLEGAEQSRQQAQQD